MRRQVKGALLRRNRTTTRRPSAVRVHPTWARRRVIADEHAAVGSRAADVRHRRNLAFPRSPAGGARPQPASGSLTGHRSEGQRRRVGGVERAVAVLSLTSPADQSMTAPPVMLISLAVIVRAQSDAANVATLATSS
jgi:hypothetical protein